jgi:tRNA threonylcarbamoyladenosine biosynthesis protein TsaE
MYKINSFKEMKRFAEWMADKIKKAPKGKGALILALGGDLGSGKTTFAQYFLRALGVKGKVTSPTFVLMKNYKLGIKNYSEQNAQYIGHTARYERAYHLDCYRLNKFGDLKAFDLKDILNVSQNIVLIEWPERIKKTLLNLPVGGVIWLNFEHGEKPNQRIIRIK